MKFSNSISRVRPGLPLIAKNISLLVISINLIFGGIENHQLYIDEVVRLHRVPVSIVSNRDPRL